ncbi:MAG: decarboxylase [Geitlerinemataceae cyanobacterium]
MVTQTIPYRTPPFSIDEVRELLHTYGSPVYIYDGDRLRQTIDRISQSVSYPHTQFRFASVTNGNVSLLQIFCQCGWGLHANTPGDAFLGLQAGFHPSQIVYSGSNLNGTEFEQLLDWGIATFNLDSIAQIRLFGEVLTRVNPSFSPRLGLRLNLPEITGDSRIGVRPSEFPDAITVADSYGLKIEGLHFYRGTGTNATPAFTEVIQPVLAAGGQLPDWNYLDFGGGFGYPYRTGGAAFEWETFGEQLTLALTELGRDMELIIEPGRSAIAGCGTLLATVVSVKWHDGKQILGVDTTVGNLSVPSVHGGYREIVCWANAEEPLYLTDVCGNTTYSRDYLGRNCQLPALQPGDILAILDVGAYGYAMSSHFLHRPRPAEVLWEKGRHRVIRWREDYQILLDGQVGN